MAGAGCRPSALVRQNELIALRATAWAIPGKNPPRFPSPTSQRKSKIPQKKYPPPHSDSRRLGKYQKCGNGAESVPW
jgi:hypothetical protein